MLDEEENVIAAMLLGVFCVGSLPASAFRSEWHQDIWAAGLSVWLERRDVDIISVSTKFNRSDIHEVLMDLCERHDVTECGVSSSAARLIRRGDDEC